MAKIIGTVNENRGEADIDWKIINFFSLEDKCDGYFCSPEFFFAETAWQLLIFPNGNTKTKSIGCVGLFVQRKEPELPLKFTFSFSLKTADGNKEKTTFQLSSFRFDNKVAWGCPRFLLRSDLEQKKSVWAPNNIFTVICTMKHTDPTALSNSFFRRLLHISSGLKKIFNNKKNTDVIFKVQEKEFSAHRIILESRSPVLAAMFNYNMKENLSGIVNIEDIHPSAFEQVLSFIYCGEIDELSFENVFDVYAAADKYDLNDLKMLCKMFVEENLTVEHVCYVIKFANLYNEEQTELRAKEYFKDNMKKVLDTDEWKMFSRENLAFSMDLITEAVKQRL